MSILQSAFFSRTATLILALAGFQAQAVNPRAGRAAACAGWCQASRRRRRIRMDWISGLGTSKSK